MFCPAAAEAGGAWVWAGDPDGLDYLLALARTLGMVPVLAPSRQATQRKRPTHSASGGHFVRNCAN